MLLRVVELDPKFARGWEALAAVSSVAPSWGERDRDYDALALKAADRALELDPTLSMPWAVKAQSTQDRWPIDFIAASTQFDRAIASDPRNATAFLWRGIFWSRLGFFDKAIADLDRAIALDPNYLNATRHKAQALLFQGKEQEAFALFESGFEKGFVTSRFENFIAPMLAHGHRSEALLLLGAEDMDRELFEAILRSLDHGQPTVPARPLVERATARADAEQRVIEFSSPTSVYVWLGDYDAAADSDDIVTTAIVAWDRYPPTWRNSPGWKRKLEKMGVVAYWRAKGYPPQCHPVGAKDFKCD
jgi:tetratricopeptide (TPR) repeat protein